MKDPQYKVKQTLPSTWANFSDEFIRNLTPDTLALATLVLAQVLCALTDEVERRLERKPSQ